MIPVAGAYLHIRKAIPTTEYKVIGKTIYEFLQTFEDTFLPEAEKGFEITIEEGSTKVWAVILTLTNVLINYGSIRQSIDYIAKDSEIVSRKIDLHLQDVWNVQSSEIISHRKQLWVPGEIKALFNKVEAKELTPEEATTKAVALIEKYTKHEEKRASKVISEKLRSEFQKSAKVAKPAKVNIAATFRDEDRKIMDVVSQHRIPQPQVPPLPSERVLHDLSRPKRLVILKRPQDAAPNYMFY